MTLDSKRNATSDEVKLLKEQNADLRRATSEQMLENIRLKKPRLNRLKRSRYVRMNADDKLTLLLAVENSGFKVKKALELLDMPTSTYYHWRANYKKYGKAGLKDKKSGPRVQWNSLLDHEVQKVLEIARDEPELTSREISFKITDTEEFSVSESSVYRVLKEEGLIQEQNVTSFPAKKEYDDKPQKVNQQWQTDATYLFVTGYGWFYLISVLDDFSRKILAWEICSTNRGDDFVRVVKKACEKAKVNPEDMPNLVSDR